MGAIRTGLVSAAVLTGSIVGAAVASADPPPPAGLTFTATCGGITYDIVSPAGGLWTPALDVDSNTVLIITSYLEYHEFVYDDDGNVADEYHDPSVLAKGQSGKRHATECTFAFLDVGNPAWPAGYTISGGGVITAVITPRGR